MLLATEKDHFVINNFAVARSIHYNITLGSMLNKFYEELLSTLNKEQIKINKWILKSFIWKLYEFFYSYPSIKREKATNNNNNNNLRFKNSLGYLNVD